MKRFLITSFVILIIIHLTYFIYGYCTFEGLKNIDKYSEYYRFKFYDDVSISHFFITCTFSILFSLQLLRRTKEKHSGKTRFKVSLLLLLISFLLFSFFISYNLGLYIRLRSDLPEKEWNKDKELLNLLNPFLYKYTSYQSEKLFNVVHILYPKPYPVIEKKDSIYNSLGGFYVTYNYYSIDTIKLLYSDFEKLDHVILDKLNLVGIDKKEWLDNIISKEEYNDSIKIIYSGMSVNPSADDSICVFIKNRELYKPIKDELIFSQQIKLAKERYNLLYKYKKDSLHNKFNQLNDLFIKYRIESSIEPKKILNDIFYYRDNDDYYLNSLRNNFDREKLKERIDGIDKLYYSFVFLNDSLSFFFYFVVFSFWIFLSSLFLVFYFIRNRKNTLKAI